RRRVALLLPVPRRPQAPGHEPRVRNSVVRVGRTAGIPWQRPLTTGACQQRGHIMTTQRKVAVITGASQGIGEGLVRGFLDRGYRVVANSRSIKPDASADVLAVAGDITEAAVADRVIAGAVEKFGRVDTLVNNAGVFVAKPFTEYTEADFAHVLSVNLAGF